MHIKYFIYLAYGSNENNTRLPMTHSGRAKYYSILMSKAFKQGKDENQPELQYMKSPKQVISTT